MIQGKNVIDECKLICSTNPRSDIMDSVKHSKPAGPLRRTVSVEILGKLRRIRAEVINSLAKRKASESQNEREEQDRELELPKLLTAEASEDGNFVPKEGCGTARIESDKVDTDVGQQMEPRESLLENGHSSDKAGGNGVGKMVCSKEAEDSVAGYIQTNKAIKHIRNWTRRISLVSEERRMSDTLKTVSSTQDGIRNVGMPPASQKRPSLCMSGRKYSIHSEEVDTLPSMLPLTTGDTKYVFRRDRRASLSTFQNDPLIHPADLTHAYRRASLAQAASLPLINDGQFQPNPELKKQAEACIKSQRFTFRNGCSNSDGSLPKLSKIIHPLQREGSTVRAKSQRINSKLQRYLQQTKSTYTTAKKMKLVHETQFMQEKNMQGTDLQKF